MQATQGEVKGIVGSACSFGLRLNSQDENLFETLKKAATGAAFGSEMTTENLPSLVGISLHIYP